MTISLTPSGLAACQAFIADHGATPLNAEQLEATIAESLASLFELLADERWLLCADTHVFGALGATYADQSYHKLTLHANDQGDDTWLVGTPDEFPVSDEYRRRRAESEAAIIRGLEK